MGAEEARGGRPVDVEEAGAVEMVDLTRGGGAEWRRIRHVDEDG